MRFPHASQMSRAASRLGAALVTLATLLAATPSPAAARRRARDYRFDGFRLGDGYAQLMRRPPYDRPCDNDPIDKRTRRAMVYGALPCRGQTFPEKTTVLIYLRMNAPGQPKYAQPIEALIWLHGQYFRKRSNFPVHPGDPLRKAHQKLGRPLGQLTLRGRRTPSLTAWRFPGDVTILAEGKLVRGVAVGAMPTDPESEQWRGVMQMLRRYTPPSGLPPATPAGLSGLCATVWSRVVACRATSRFARKMAYAGDRFVRKCTRRLRDPEGQKQLRCLAQSRTCPALDACLER